MLIESLDLAENIKNLIINQDGIKKLYPPQGEAVDKGLLTGKNLVISIPTAAGKTLLAELAALKHVTEHNGKVIYLCPLRALASEKFKDFKRFNILGVRTTITSGDYDSTDDYLPKYDIIVSTNEKFDALLRHRVTWITEEVSLVVIDECHLINDQHRGPTLETLLARLLVENTVSQIIALSATIGNADEIAEWLDAELVKSDWRPVPLKEGVYFEDQITYSDYTKRDVPFHRDDPIVNLALDSIQSQEQMLVFTPSRRTAVSKAEKLGSVIESFIEPNEAKELAEIASQVVLNLSDPLSKKLADTIKKGVAFHHAGLNSRQRELVESGFKTGVIKTICATPTLCLDENTMIWHGISQTKVSKLISSKSILALNNGMIIPTKYEKIISNGKISDLIEFSSVSGYKIEVTPNHKMYVKRNGTKMIIRADLISENDKIATIGKLRFDKTKQYSINDFIPNCDKNIGKLKFDSDMAYFIGLMLGDGYSGAETIAGTINFKGSPCIVGNDDEILEHSIKIAKKLKISARRNTNSYGTSQIILGKNKWFRAFLVHCGVEKSVKKYIPKRIMKMELENISSLLNGLFDSDGYVNSGRSLGFGNTSKHLIKQTQKMLLRFGIVCSLRKRKGGIIKLKEREYKTKENYELLITQKESILIFHNKIGFRLKRKRFNLLRLVKEISSNIHYTSCKKCGYKIFKDLFEGRAESHKKWGKQKLAVIELLGVKGELGSRQIKQILGFEPKKGERRLDHHYELIKKRKIGKISKTEWFWSLNSIGNWIYENLLKREYKFLDFFDLSTCPLCGDLIEYSLKKGWRACDIEKDIFWDVIRSIKRKTRNSKVYDVVLPNFPKNDHMFVANGFIVHNSAGINLPAKRVIISSVYRYSVEEGSHPIKTLEYKQMAGRAGRPQFDKEGESILLAKKFEALDWLMDRYINRDAESIYSKLAAKPALRRNILGLIASRVVTNVSDLLNFFEKTFYGYQFEAVFLEGKIREVVDLLIGWLMIRPLDANETLEATQYGIRVSQLYLDPETAASIAEGLTCAVQQKRKKIHPVALLDLVVGTPDMITLSFRKNDWGVTEKRFSKFSSRLIQQVPDSDDIEYEFRLRDFRTTLFLWDWIKELPIEKLIMRYNIGSGDIHRIVETGTWVVSATAEIAELYSRKDKKYKILAKAAQTLSERVEYGIESDGVSLTRIRGIGRKRARTLMNHGIRDITKLLTLNAKDLAKVPGFGSELAEAILKEGRNVIHPNKEVETLENGLENYLSE